MADLQSPSNHPNSRKPSLCEECRENQWKYRCPGCGLVSCSLPCVKSHKVRLGCTGKRPRTEFIPISEFDDKTFLSDYQFLEETKRIAEVAHRIKTGFGTNYRRALPNRLLFLMKAASRRGTSLCFLPRGMSKSESNLSRFDRRRNCIFWTIEWRFRSVRLTLTDHDVPETESLERLIKKHLSPTPWNDNLTSYRNVPLSDLRFFIQKHAKTSRSLFRELDIKLPMDSQLRKVLILEYPVIHVFLPTEAPDFEIEKPVKCKIIKGRNAGPLNQVRDVLPVDPAAKCSIYKEEEIEEEETELETRVIDLSDRDVLPLDPAAKCSIYKEEEIEEEETELETRVIDLSEHTAQNSNFSSAAPSMHKCSTVASLAKEGNQSHNSMGGVIEEEEELDFDQEVEQAYNDLIGEIDPDDFLCFDDDGFINVVHYNGNKAIGSEQQELEEGEIPA
ncbi:Box C/D snoRNA protein 1 [Rhynchospora pubera]|uniref:Box C/D snoRNA protein 1 n=1 Tax=Rhynchospora pubera TaxID=906938 RepID=A0AAV8GY81_9POAL|nr:Box C/D snoRNA protein 1 [Rhynchospora pubera]